MLHDALAILTLVVLEGLLSGDNALVLAVLVKPLPKPQQKRALLYGIVGAFVLRFLALASAEWLIRIWYLRAAGGLYLGYLAASHFIRRAHSRGPIVPKPVRGFWHTVWVVELTDLAFAVDSIIVAVGLSPKLWVVWTGGILGIIAMRVVAGMFVRLLERYPALEDTAYAMVGWIAIKLGVESFEIWSAPDRAHALMPRWIFWLGIAVVAGVGSLVAIRSKNRLASAGAAQPDPSAADPGTASKT
jgi:YkoY family integral membrane protein